MTCSTLTCYMVAAFVGDYRKYSFFYLLCPRPRPPLSPSDFKNELLKFELQELGWLAIAYTVLLSLFLVLRASQSLYTIRPQADVSLLALTKIVNTIYSSGLRP
jgi:hypothetical protein